MLCILDYILLDHIKSLLSVESSVANLIAVFDFNGVLQDDFDSVDVKSLIVDKQDPSFRSWFLDLVHFKPENLL